MAESPPLVSLAEQFTGLPMRDLIGAPLMAAADANSAMAVTQTRFLLDTAFARSGTGDETAYSPVLIKMTLTRGVLVPIDPTANPPQNPDIQQVTTQFDLPLLTILPLNSLAVDSVDVNFHMEVQSSFSDSTNEKTEEAFATQTDFTTKLGFGLFSAEVTGSVSYNNSRTQERNIHYEKSNSAEYTVMVHAGQLPLPEGVNTIIEAFTNSISPITFPTT